MLFKCHRLLSLSRSLSLFHTIAWIHTEDIQIINPEGYDQLIGKHEQKANTNYKISFLD